MKKKVLSLVLALTMMVGMSTTAFADYDGDYSTPLTYTMPASAYSFVYPSSQEEPFVYGDTSQKRIGTVSVTVADISIREIRCGLRDSDAIMTNSNGSSLDVKLWKKANSISVFTEVGTSATFELYSTTSTPNYNSFDIKASIEDWSGAEWGTTYTGSVVYHIYVNR